MIVGRRYWIVIWYGILLLGLLGWAASVHWGTLRSVTMAPNSGTGSAVGRFWANLAKSIAAILPD